MINWSPLMSTNGMLCPNATTVSYYCHDLSTTTAYHHHHMPCWGTYHLLDQCTSNSSPSFHWNFTSQCFLLTSSWSYSDY